MSSKTNCPKVCAVWTHLLNVGHLKHLYKLEVLDIIPIRHRLRNNKTSDSRRGIDEHFRMSTKADERLDPESPSFGLLLKNVICDQSNQDKITAAGRINHSEMHVTCPLTLLH